MKGFLNLRDPLLPKCNTFFIIHFKTKVRYNYKNYYEFIQKVTDFIKKNEKTNFWNELSLTEQKEIKQGIEEPDRKTIATQNQKNEVLSKQC